MSRILPSNNQPAHVSGNAKYLDAFNQRHFRETQKNLTSEQINTLGACLENFKHYLGTSGSAFLEADGIQSTSVGFAKQYGLDIIYKTIVNQLAPEIASVQPIFSRNSKVRYFEYFYEGATEQLIGNPYQFNFGDPSAGVTGVNREKITTDPSGDVTATLTAKPIYPNTLVIQGESGNIYIDNGDGQINAANSATPKNYGTINYTTGALAITGLPEVSADLNVQYSVDNITTPVQNVKRISTRVRELPITAQSIKVLTSYAVEAVMEMQMEYGMGIHDEFVDQVVTEVQMQIDNDLLGAAKMHANISGNLSVWKMITNSSSLSQPLMREHYQEFGIKLSEAGSKMYRSTKAVRPNILVIGTGLIQVVEQLATFTSSGIIEPNGNYVMGNIGVMKVIVSPIYGENDAILFFKGTKKLQASLIYAPFLPISKVFTTNAEAFENYIGVHTSYGVAVPNRNWFAKVDVQPQP